MNVNMFWWFYEAYYRERKSLIYLKAYLCKMFWKFYRNIHYVISMMIPVFTSLDSNPTYAHRHRHTERGHKKVVVGKSCQNKVCSIFYADWRGIVFFKNFFLKVIFRPLNIMVWPWNCPFEVYINTEFISYNTVHNGLINIVIIG